MIPEPKRPVLSKLRFAMTRAGALFAGLAAALIGCGAHAQRLQERRLPGVAPSGGASTGHTKHLVGGPPDAGPPKPFALREVFPLKHGESATLRPGDLNVAVESADYSPMEWIDGVEAFPYTVFHLVIRCAGTTLRRDVSGTSPMPVCGLVLSLDRVEGEDDGFFVVTEPPAADRAAPR
jgi:hypothetical protein